MYAEYGKKEDKDNSYRYYRMEDFIYDYTFKDIYMFQDVPKTMQSKVLSRLTFTTITKAKKNAIQKTQFCLWYFTNKYICYQFFFVFGSSKCYMYIRRPTRVNECPYLILLYWPLFVVTFLTTFTKSIDVSHIHNVKATKNEYLTNSIRNGFKFQRNWTMFEF